MAYDSLGAGTENITAASTSWSHTLPAGGCVIVVCVHQGGLADQVSAVDVGGEACTKLSSVSNGGNSAVDLWGKATSLTGAQTITVTASLSNANSNSMAFTGRATSSVFGTAATNTNTGASIAVTVTAASGDDLAAVAGDDSGYTFSTLTNGTMRWSPIPFYGTGVGSADNVAGNTVLTANNQGPGGNNEMIGVAIKPAAGGAATWPGWMHSRGGWTA